MGIYNQIRAGLAEAIAYEQGTLNAKTTRLSVKLFKCYNDARRNAIWKSTGWITGYLCSLYRDSSKTMEDGGMGGWVQSLGRRSL